MNVLMHRSEQRRVGRELAHPQVIADEQFAQIDDVGIVVDGRIRKRQLERQRDIVARAAAVGLAVAQLQFAREQRREGDLPARQHHRIEMLI
jgi:hypothetical protein